MRRTIACWAVIALTVIAGCNREDEENEGDEAAEAAQAAAPANPGSIVAQVKSSLDSASLLVAITEEKTGLLGQATVQPEQARQTALGAHPTGTITKAELEEEDGKLIYSFDITIPGEAGITEVHVDAKTGTVIKTEHEGGEESEAAEKAEAGKSRK